MQLKITNFVKSPPEHLYWSVPLLIWELELTDVNNYAQLTQELLRDDIWLEHKNYPRGRYMYNRDTSPLLTEFVLTVESHLPQVVYDTMFLEREVNANRHLPVEWYKKHGMCCDIYKDTAGFEMPPHMDNHHIVAQAIVNITSSDTATKFHSPSNYNSESRVKWQDLPAQYTASHQALKGVAFFNNSNSVHSISGVTKDRFILYQALVDYTMQT
jgi:hypothetical protein